jgi:hypothetical protein
MPYSDDIHLPSFVKGLVFGLNKAAKGFEEGPDRTAAEIAEILREMALHSKAIAEEFAPLDSHRVRRRTRRS